MLKTDTGQFASAGLPAANDANGTYIPDAIVGPVIDAARNAAPAMFDNPPVPRKFSINDPTITYDQTRTLILDALEKFDPRLKAKAEEIFRNGYDSAIKANFIEGINEPLVRNDSQWRLREVDKGKTHIMRSLAADSERSELDPPNKNPHAVIQYEFDKTINSLIYIAHELGHSIADAWIRDEHGRKTGDNPKHMDEFQAYIVQSIIYEALKKSSDPDIARAARQHFNETAAQSLEQIPGAVQALDKQATTAGNAASAWVKPDKKLEDRIAGLHSRPVSFLLAAALVQQMMGKDAETRDKFLGVALGREGATNLSQVLDIAGVKTSADMQALAAEAISPAAPKQTAPALRNTGAAKSYSA
jgi:hypothetical protein